MRRLLAGLLWAAPGAALADAAGDQALAEMDEALNEAEDLFFKYDVVHQEPGKPEPRLMQFTVTVKGEWNLTEFLAPADQKGTKVLVLARDQMYIWLPQFNKLRRVASHTTEQGFMGTTFEYDDMATPYYGRVFDGRLVSDDGTVQVVEATAKADAAVQPTYKTLRITIRKDIHLPTKIEYLDSKGAVARTNTRDDYVCEADGVCAFKVMRTTDHTRSDTWTELRMVEWAHDQGLSDDLFTVRALQRGM